MGYLKKKRRNIHLDLTLAKEHESDSGCRGL